MLNDVKGWLGDAKDKLVSTGAKALVNREISRYGEFTRLDIDSKAKTIHATLDLKEEAQYLEITITGYSLYERNGHGYVQVGTFESSKAWFAQIAKGLLVGNEFKVPRKLFDFLKALV